MENDSDSECSINNDTPIYGINCSFFDTKNKIDEIAFRGRCFINEKRDCFKKRGYKSKILDNPTYRDLVKIADELIETTEDYHHRFFEGITMVKKKNSNLFEISIILGS